MNDSLFKSWVPKWASILMYLFIFFPALFINGAYSSNAAEMVSGLGIISEHVMFATFMSAIGLVIAGPFLVSVLRTFSKRFIFIVGFSALFGLSYVCGVTDSMPLLFVCSLLMGIVRVFIMLSSLFGLLGIIAGVDVLDMLSAPPASGEEAAKKDKFRGFMQSASYFLFLTIGQIGSFLTAKMAYEYHWQYVYLYVGAFVFIALLLVFCMMKPENVIIGKGYDFPPVSQAISATVFLSAVCYLLVYGKTFDWFDDDRICISAGIALISLAVFVLQHIYCRKKFIDFKAFAVPSVIVAMVFFTLVMFMNSSSVLVTTFMGMSMKLDSVKAASISNWQILGFGIGMIINIVMLVKGTHSRWFIIVGFLLMTASAVYMYFQYQAMATYESMILPTVLRSIGMWMIYAYCGCYGMNQLDIGKQLGTWVFIMLIFRAVLGPAGGATIYSNAVNQRSQDHIVRIAQDYDNVYPEFARIPVASAKGSVQQQAMLVTLKELTGWTIFGGLGCVLLAFVFPYSSWRIGRKKAPAPT